jgi:transposase
MNVTTIGLDLAKSVFQVHGIDVHGKALITRQLRREGPRVLCQPAVVSGWHRSLCQRASLGPRDQQARS